MDYVWANEKVRFNLFISGDYDSYSDDASSDSRLLAPDSSLSSIIATKGHSKNRTLNGNFGVDFDYYLDSATTLNFWLWTTASHDSSATDSRTERTEFISSPGRYFYNETPRSGMVSRPTSRCPTMSTAKWILASWRASRRSARRWWLKITARFRKITA